MREQTVAVAVCVLFSFSWTAGQAPYVQTDLLKLADEVLTEVSRLRELDVKAPVARGVKSRDEIRTYLTSRLDKEYPADELEIEQKVMARLALIPKDLELRKLLLGLLTEQAAGYYDPVAKTFYIADWLAPVLQKPVMAHELTHALQDQHFDVSPFLQRIQGNDDAMLARSAVLEGDALAVMLDYILKPLGMDFINLPDLAAMTGVQAALANPEFKVFASAPPYLRELLLFPYTGGAVFLQSFRQAHSWREVDKIYRDLPQSSEQILHPSKYWTIRDEPTPVSHGSPPELEPDSWKRIYANVLGEFNVLQVLKRYLDAEEARRSAGGWDGDSIQLFQDRQGRLALFLRTVWDSPEEARQFSDSYRRLLSKKYPQATIRDEEERVVWDSETAGGFVSLEGVWVEALEMDK